MKAAIYTQYGPPEVLRLAEATKPAPQSGEVLIRVRAATVTAGDVNIRGFTFIPAGFGPLPRLMFGIRAPRKPILGTELAGEIEAVGAGVTNFTPGDCVFGIDSTRLGAYAEYVCRSAQSPLAHIPAGLSFEEAASVPFGAGAALYFLRDLAKVQPGMRVLVNGASGGVGVYGVQLAKHYGAEVTGVCSGANVEFVRSLGADHVIDYTKEDFATAREVYDIIMDTVAGRADFNRCKGALRPGGRYLAVAGGPRELAQMAWTSVTGGKRVLFGSPAETQASMLALKELLEMGAIRPVIGGRYTLEQIVEAHRFVDTGRKRGSIVITV
jgi:NADPH:quinone reductase-like Zn-dependent oxidoreductase